jgi:hypothetical protein
MQKYKMWCAASHGHQMLKAKADEFGYYLAPDVEALLSRIRDAIQGDEGSVVDEINSVLMDAYDRRTEATAATDPGTCRP